MCSVTTSPDARYSHVHLDVVGPLPPSNGFTFLLTYVDQYTRWAEAIPLPNVQAETVVKVFVSRWVAMFGAPSTVTTDRGAQVESALFQTLLNFPCCTCIRTTAYQPAANGMVELFHRQLKTALRAEPEDTVGESQYLRRVFRENGYPRNFVNQCMRKRDERHNRADPKFWRAIPYIKNVFEAVSRLLAPLGVGVSHRTEATMRRQVMRPQDPLPRQETSGVVYRIWCSCGQSNYVGETGRLLRTRIAEHVAAVRRNDANSQVAAHSTRPGHTFKFDEAEILARGDTLVSRELLESWFTGPQSINKCNDIPTPYSFLRHRLAKALDYSRGAQAREPDGLAIITPACNTGKEMSAINNWHAGHQAISAPTGNNP
nr:unnamed protein product [Spirometra erinaceieuropaei]